MPLPNFITKKRKPDTTTDGNANNRRQSHNEGLHKSLPSFNSIKRNSLTSNYTNNNTPSSPHEKLRNNILLPLEGFPDPPYDKEIFQREKQPTLKRLCRNFQDILDSAHTFDCSVLSRASTPSLSSNKEFTSLVQYFQEFLKTKCVEEESNRVVNLLQFWLDVQSFKAVCTSLNVEEYSNNGSSAEQETNNCDSQTQNDIWKSKPSLKCDNSEVQNDRNHLTQVQTKWKDEIPSNNDVVSAQRNVHERDSGSIKSYDSGIVTSPTASHASHNSNESTTCHSSLTTTSSKHSIVDIANEPADTNIGNSGLNEERNKIPPEIPVGAVTCKENCTEMALAIYQSYIAPDAPFDIVSDAKRSRNDSNDECNVISPCSVQTNLTRVHVNDIISGICPQKESENSLTSVKEPVPTCFDSATLYVADLLEMHYYNEFIQSSFYAKYQLQILTKVQGDSEDNSGGQEDSIESRIAVPDIFKNDSLLSSFMEFMDSTPTYSPGRSLIEFWLCATNFRDLCPESLPDGGRGASRDSLDDAVGIYNKFVSMEATTPLGFSSVIRSRIEDRICEERRIDNDNTRESNSQNCFDEAIMVVEAAIREKYLTKFLSSSVFKKYLGVLQLAAVNTSSAKKFSSDSSKAPHSGYRDRLRHADSSNSLNTSYSSEYGINSSHISSSNTLLADGTVISSSGTKRTGTHFLDRYTLDPNRLWKRKQYHISNIGHVDYLGRYRSCYEKLPDQGTNKSTDASNRSSAPMSTRLSRAMRRLVVSEDEDQMREEMAWQNAQSIIEEIRENLNRPNNKLNVTTTTG